MKKNLFILTLFIFAHAQWSVDNSVSKIGFTVTHLVFSEVEGNFKSFKANMTSVKEDFSDAQITFSADVNSINTDNEKRDGHLKSDDFFNAEKYPEFKFVSTSFTKVNAKTYKVVGNFTMRDITKELTFEAELLGIIKAYGGTRASFKLKGSLNRFDFGLKWSNALETGELVVANEVLFDIKIVMSKK